MDKKKKKLKKPNPFTYAFFYSTSKLISKFKFNLKVERNDLKHVKGSYLLLANHESAIDFMNACAAVKRRQYFVISNSFFNSLPINPLLKSIQAIPKQQFQTSYDSLKKMKKVIDNGRPLIMYPAGLMTADGISTPIPKATGKLLRFLKTDVYVAITEGSYFTKPKWSKKFRKGVIKLNIVKLFSKDELNNYKDEELQNAIEGKLNYNSYDKQEVSKLIFKGQENIEGLENVLYQCPKCKKEFSIYEKDHKLICSNCKNSAIVDKYGFLNKINDDDIIYKKPSDWSKFIQDELYEIIKKDDNYSLSSECEIAMINYKKHRFDIVGHGNISLNCNEFHITGILNELEFDKEFSIKETYILPFSPGRHFEIQDGNDIYRIFLKNPIETTKWINAIKAFYKIRHNGQITS